MSKSHPVNDRAIYTDWTASCPSSKGLRQGSRGGAFAPMAIMGKYYMHYGRDFLPPRELGRECARRLIKELMLDHMGLCRFHRGWAEEMIPDIVEKTEDKLWNTYKDFSLDLISSKR